VLWCVMVWCAVKHNDVQETFTMIKYECKIAAESLHNRFTIASQSLHNHFTISLFSLKSIWLYLERRHVETVCHPYASFVETMAFCCVFEFEDHLAGLSGVGDVGWGLGGVVVVLSEKIKRGEWCW
jgi:hypothetical protein